MGSDQPTTDLWKGMVLPKCWIGLAWVVAFYGCVAQTQALLSEDELIRALLAAREAEDSGYIRGAIPVVEKRRQQASAPGQENVGVGRKHSAAGQASEHRSAHGRGSEVEKCQSTMKCPNMPAPATCDGNEALENRLKILRRHNLRKGQREEATGLHETSGSRQLDDQ